MPASENTTVIFPYPDISSVPDTFGSQQEESTNISILGKNLLLFWRARLTKPNFKKTERRKKIDIGGNLPPKYSCRRRFSPVLVTQMFQSFVGDMRWRQSSSLDSEDCEEPSLLETAKENSDIEAECLYFSGLYIGDRRGKNWIKCTKSYKWCNDERSGTDDWKPISLFFSNPK